MFDGVLNVGVNTGWGKMFSTYEIYYPLLDGESFNITKVDISNQHRNCNLMIFTTGENV